MIRDDELDDSWWKMIHDDLDDFMMEFKDWIFGGQFKYLIIQKSLKPKFEMDLHN